MNFHNRWRYITNLYLYVSKSQNMRIFFINETNLVRSDHWIVESCYDLITHILDLGTIVPLLRSYLHIFGSQSRRIVDQNRDSVLLSLCHSLFKCVVVMILEKNNVADWHELFDTLILERPNPHRLLNQQISIVLLYQVQRHLAMCQSQVGLIFHFL